MRIQNELERQTLKCDPSCQELFGASRRQGAEKWETMQNGVGYMECMRWPQGRNWVEFASMTHPFRLLLSFHANFFIVPCWFCVSIHVQRHQQQHRRWPPMGAALPLGSAASWAGQCCCCA